MNTKNWKLFQAYTLVEILLAVAIVGILAAIVLPMIITKYQNNVFQRAYDREVNSITQAVDSLHINENKINFFDTMMYSNSELESLDNYSGLFLKKYFRVSKYCGDNPNNCFANKYYKYENRDKKIYVPTYIGSCAILKNGVSICLTPQIGNRQIKGLLDLNGLKGPNVFGRDLRGFELSLKERRAFSKDTEEIYYTDYLVQSGPSTPPPEEVPPNPCEPKSTNWNTGACCLTTSRQSSISSYTDACCNISEVKDSVTKCKKQTGKVRMNVTYAQIASNSSYITYKIPVTMSGTDLYGVYYSGSLKVECVPSGNEILNKFNFITAEEGKTHLENLEVICPNHSSGGPAGLKTTCSVRKYGSGVPIGSLSGSGCNLYINVEN